MPSSICHRVLRSGQNSVHRSIFSSYRNRAIGVRVHGFPSIPGCHGTRRSINVTASPRNSYSRRIWRCGTPASRFSQNVSRSPAARWRTNSGNAIYAISGRTTKQTLLVGAFLGGRLARACLLRRRFWMEALGKHLLACRAVPLLVLVVGDLALHKQLCELSALRLALERHQAEASKRQARFGLARPDASRTSWSVNLPCHRFSFTRTPAG